MPRLLRVWRALTKRSGHATELSAAELRDVAQGVTRISQGLTRERLLVGARYMDDPQLLGAYLLFYWPISYAQGRSILGELGGLQGRVLDLGSGPGPL
ncbi:MAG: methyltransferase type 12, partial [Myxococcaceae bacterium]